MPHSIPADRAAPEAAAPESVDRIVTDLRELRAAAGSPSYAELGRRVGELRLARGVRPAAAIPARSTVYNLFREGRVRIDADLLRDVVIALGESREVADTWVDRSRKASRTSAPPAPEPQIASLPESFAPARFAPQRISPGLTVVIVVGCVLLNVLGLAAQRALALQVYLDMVGTGLAAIALGPWYGVLVAVAAQAADVRSLGDPAELPFLLVSTTGALVWGYGVRSWRMGATLSRYLALNLLVALACTTLVTPILIALSEGKHGHLSDLFTGSLEDSGVHLAAAVFTSNIISSVLDKLLSGLIMLALFVTLHRVAAVPAAHMPVVEQLAALGQPRVPRAAGHRSAAQTSSDGTA